MFSPTSSRAVRSAATDGDKIIEPLVKLADEVDYVIASA
jgi:hypothetical protein